MRLELVHVLQNDFKMRAAFSHSLSRVVGQYASLPKLAGTGAAAELLARLAEEPAQPKTLSSDTGTSDGLDLVVVVVVLFVLAAPVLVLSHEGSSAETRCMMTAPGPDGDLGFQGQRWESATTQLSNSNTAEGASGSTQLSGC